MKYWYADNEADKQAQSISKEHQTAFLPLYQLMLLDNFQTKMLQSRCNAYLAYLSSEIKVKVVSLGSVESTLT